MKLVCFKLPRLNKIDVRRAAFRPLAILKRREAKDVGVSRRIRSNPSKCCTCTKDTELLKIILPRLYEFNQPRKDVFAEYTMVGRHQ